MTGRGVLISLSFAFVFAASMAFIHSLVVLCYALAACSVALGVYWSLLAHTYKKKRSLGPLLPNQRTEKVDELSGGWWEGWAPIVGAICFFGWGFSEQLTSNTIGLSIFGWAIFCGVSGFVVGFAYLMVAWWLWRKYVAAVKRFTQS